MAEVHKNVETHRFELEIDDQVAKAFYREQGNVVTFVHTEVPKALGGRGVGSALVRGALDAVRAAGEKARILCPFFGAWLRRHPDEYRDIIEGPLPIPRQRRETGGGG
jgi:predicted GNAT family acetyltransferase